MTAKTLTSNSKKTIKTAMLGLAIAMLTPALMAAPAKKTNAKTKATAVETTAAPAKKEALKADPLATSSHARISEAATEKTKKAFNINLALEYGSNFYADGDTGHSASTTLTLSPTYKINERLTLAAEAGIEKLSTGSGDTSMTNTVVTLAIAGYKFNSDLKLSHSISATLPTNEEVRKRDRLQGAGSLGTKILGTLKYVNIVGGLSVKKNIHEFDFNANGSANIEYVIAERLGFDFPLTEKFAYTLTGIYLTAYTYEKSQRNSFVFDTGLDYSATKSFGLSAGITNSASTLQANGRDSNIALYDDKTSSMRAGLSYSF